MSDKLTVGPIERQKTYELVAERLTEEIISRRLRPGDVLPPERELGESYEVGRSSVREALRILESRGLIESANGTFMVADLRNPLDHSLDFLVASDEADYRELFEVRRILEGEAAALAASRRLDAEIDRMNAEVEAMDAGLGSEEEFITADLRFHLTVAKASRNRLIAHLMHAIRSLLQDSLSSSYHIEGSAERAIEMHRLILGAIAGHQPEEARQLMQEHVSRVERDITQSSGKRRA